MSRGGASGKKRGLVMVEFRPIALVSLVGLCLCAGCSKEEPATVTPASGSGSSADAEASRPERPSAGIDPALLEQLPSLARVEQALSGAPVMGVRIVLQDGAAHSVDCAESSGAESCHSTDAPSPRPRLATRAST